MHWRISHRFDRVACRMADRHYSRRKVGSNQFVPPGRCLVLLHVADDALWTSSWQEPQYTLHQWKGAWVNTLFRNEGETLSSKLIRDAVAATRWKWGDPPEQGMVTFIDTDKVRKKRDFGRCYRKAGFRHVGETKDRHLLALQLAPEDMPEACAPVDTQIELMLGGALQVTP
jgi:hypothetical protein